MVVSMDEYADPMLPRIAGAMFSTPVGGLVPVELADGVATAAALPSDIARVTDHIRVGSDTVSLVLVGGGALSRNKLESVGDLSILGVPLTGHPSSRGLVLAEELTAGKHGSVDWQGSFLLLPPAPRAWTAGAAAAQREIAAFVRSVLDS